MKPRVNNVFSTPNTRQTIFSESFDTGIPSDWTQVIYSGTGTWQWELDGYAGEFVGTDGLYAEADSDENPDDVYDVGLFTPPIDLSGYTSVTLEFDRDFQDYVGYGYAECNVYSGEPMVFEENLWAQDEDDPSCGVHAVFTIDPSGYTDPSQVYIEFYYSTQGGTWAWYFKLDNVVLSETPSEIHDVGIDGIVLYAWPWAVGETDTMEVIVTNYGTEVETNVPVHVEVGPFSDDLVISSIDPGMSESAFFEFIPATEQIADILTYTMLPGDNNPYNDTLVWNEYFYPEGTFWAEGFEYITSFPPPGWTVINNDGGSYTWDWYYGYPHTGLNMTAVRWEAPNNDDWLITDIITPQSDYADSIGFFYAAYSSYYPEYLQVWAMSGQTVDDTIALLWEDPANAVTDYQRVTISLDDFDGQNIYIGFRSLSPDAYYNILDDIFYSTVYSPTVVEEGLTDQAKLSLAISKNPVRDRGTLFFIIPKEMSVEINLYDASGRLTKNITTGRYTAGAHSVEFSVGEASSGIYFVTLTADEKTLTSKLIVVK